MFSLITHSMLHSCHESVPAKSEKKKAIARLMVLATLIDLAVAGTLMGLGAYNYCMSGTASAFLSVNLSKIFMGASGVYFLLPFLFVSDQCRGKRHLGYNTVCQVACGRCCGPFFD